MKEELDSSAKNLVVRRYTDPSAFVLLQPYWNSLLRNTSVDDPFLTWEWQSSWWQHYGANSQMWLLVAWENDEPVGIAPLMGIQMFKRGIKTRMLCIIGQWDIDHGGLIVPDERPDVLEAFGSFLVKHNQEWDIVRLYCFLSGAQDLTPFFLAFRPDRFICNAFEQFPHYYIPLGGDWRTFFDSLSKNLRRNLNRISQDAENNKIQVLNLVGTEISPQHLEDFFYIGLGGKYPHLYRNANDRDFHRTLLKKMGPKGWIGLSILYIDGVPASYRYGFIYHDRFFDWRTAYTSQSSELSPGSLLFRYMIEYFFSRYKEIDFLRGDATFKKRWTDLSRNYINWQVVRRCRLSALMFVYYPAWKNWLLRFFKIR